MDVQSGNKYLDMKGFYKPQTKEEYKGASSRIISFWKRFLEAQGESKLKLHEDYYIHKRNLYEVIKRLDKRKTYYYVFHKIGRICEYKEIGILCYWLNTLKPFMVVNQESKLYNAPNEMFSLYLILCTLAEIHKKKRPKENFIPPDDYTLQDYIYNFKYCDMSREATIFFVETLAKSYGIGMETNLVNDMREDDSDEDDLDDDDLKDEDDNVEENE